MRKNGKLPQTKWLIKMVRRLVLGIPDKRSHITEATLKNDDAEASEDEGSDDDITAQEAKALRSENAARRILERQPTGRIVGIIKRNWRA